MPILQLGQRATASIKWVDNAGNPVKPIGHTSWSSSDPAVLSCIQSNNPDDADIRALQAGDVMLFTEANFDAGPVSIGTSIHVHDGKVVEGEVKLNYGLVSPIR